MRKLRIVPKVESCGRGYWEFTVWIPSGPSSSRFCVSLTDSALYDSRRDAREAMVERMIAVRDALSEAIASEEAKLHGRS